VLIKDGKYDEVLSELQRQMERRGLKVERRGGLPRMAHS